MPATTRAHAANKLKIVGGKYISSKAKIGGECSKAMSAWKSSKSGMPAGVGKILGKCRAQAQALRKGVMYREAGQELKAQVQEHRAFHGTVGVAARASEARAKIEARKQAQAAWAKTIGPTGPSLREQVAIARGKKGTREERLQSALGRTTARATALYDASKGNAREDSATRAKAYEAFTRGKTTSARAVKLESAIKGAPPAAKPAPAKPTLKEQAAAYRAKDQRRATPELLATTKASAVARRAKASQSRFEHKREFAYEGMREPGRVRKPEPYKIDYKKQGRTYRTVKTPTPQAEVDAANAARSKRAKDILEARAAFNKTPEAQARIKAQAATVTAHDRARFPLFGGKLPTEIPYEHLAQARATAERLRAATGAGSTPGHAGPLAGGRETGIGTPTVKPQGAHDFSHLDEFGGGHVSHAHPPGSPAHLSSAAGAKLTLRERRRLESQYAIKTAAGNAAGARRVAEERKAAQYESYKRASEKPHELNPHKLKLGDTVIHQPPGGERKVYQVQRFDSNGVPHFPKGAFDSFEATHEFNKHITEIRRSGGATETIASPAPKVTLPETPPAAAQPAAHGLSDDIVKQHSAPYQGRHDPYMTHADAQAGYPETLKRLRAYSPEQLSKESADMRKASFDRMFGHNARKALTLVEQVQYEKQKLAGANAAAPMAVVSDRTRQATGDHGTVGHSGSLAGGRETGIGTKSLREQAEAKRSKKGTREQRIEALSTKLHESRMRLHERSIDASSRQQREIRQATHKDVATGIGLSRKHTLKSRKPTKKEEASIESLGRTSRELKSRMDIQDARFRKLTPSKG